MKKIVVGVLIFSLLLILSAGCNCQIAWPTVYTEIEPGIRLVDSDSFSGFKWDARTAEPIIISLGVLPIEVRQMACLKFKNLNITLNPNRGMFGPLGLYYAELNKIEIISNNLESLIDWFVPDSPRTLLHEFGHAVDYNNPNLIRKHFPDYSEESFAEAFAAYVLCPEKLIDINKDQYAWLQKYVFKSEPQRELLYEWTNRKALSLYEAIDRPEIILSKSFLLKEVEGVYSKSLPLKFVEKRYGYYHDVFQNPPAKFKIRLTNQKKKQDEDECLLVDSILSFASDRQSCDPWYQIRLKNTFGGDYSDINIFLTIECLDLYSECLLQKLISNPDQCFCLEMKVISGSMTWDPIFNEIRFCMKILGTENTHFINPN